ncbi:UNVERIFIED_CONTAM: NADPH-dependent FMN reductase [Acetivibrio alkalicellulosi]
MKVLTIIGSAKNGNTSEIIRCFKEELKKLGEYEFEDLYLEDFKIDFCTGCHNCIFIGEDKCPHYNDVKAIEDKILVSDILILATPGYMFSVTGIMKNFLDHVAYNCHRPKYFSKKIFYISSCTKWQEKGVFIPMQTWGSAAGFSFIGKMYIDMLPLPFTEKEKMKRRKRIKKSAVSFDKSAMTIVDIKPDFGGVVIFHSFRTICKIAPKIMKADYEYFKKIKAYDKDTKWYVNAKISPIKHYLANFIEKRIEKAINKMIDKNEIDNCKGSFKNKL